MSIKKLQQLGMSRPKIADEEIKPNPRDDSDEFDLDNEDGWAGMLDDDDDFANEKNTKKQTSKPYAGFNNEADFPSYQDDGDEQDKKIKDKGKFQYAGNHPLNFEDDGDDDSDDDFGAKIAKNKRLDDDTPHESSKNDDEDLEDINFDFAQATKDAKVEEKGMKINEDRKRKEIEDLLKKNRMEAEQKERDELEKIMKRDKERNEMEMSRGKGSTIDKGKDNSNGPISEDFSNLFKEQGNKGKQSEKGESFNIDLSMNNNNIENIDDKKSFEELDLERRFEDIEDDEPYDET